MSAAKRTLFAGEINVDLVLQGYSEFPVPGKEVLVQDFAMVLGSATAIMAMGLARLGTPVAFLGRVGDDVWGRYCLEDMAGRGIDLSRVIRGGGLKTGVTVSITHPADRALVTYLGAISALTGADVPDAAMAGLDHLHVSSFFFQEGLRPDLPELFARARRAGLTTSLDTGFDPSGRWDSGLRETLRETDLFFPNEVELRALSGCDDPAQGIRALDNGRTRVVAKLGTNGAMALDGRTVVHVPAYTVERSTPPAPATPSTPASCTAGCRARRSPSACGSVPPAVPSARSASAARRRSPPSPRPRRWCTRAYDRRVAGRRRAARLNGRGDAAGSMDEGGSYRWWIGGLLFLSTVINYLDRQTLSVLAPSLKTEFHWTNQDFALIVISFRVAYAVMQTVSGRLIDRLGTRNGLTLAVVFYSLAAMLTSRANGLVSFCGFRFLLGAGEAANWPAATKAVSEWFPRRERGWAVALFDSGSSIGAAVAPVLVVLPGRALRGLAARVRRRRHAGLLLARAVEEELPPAGAASPHHAWGARDDPRRPRAGTRERGGRAPPDWLPSPASGRCFRCRRPGA